MSRFTRFFLAGFGLIIVINITGLWVMNVVLYQQVKSFDKRPQIQEDKSLLSRFTDRETFELLESDVANLGKNLEEVGDDVKDLHKKSSKLVGTSAPVQTLANAPKESVLFLGSGSSSKTDWTTLTSAQINIDTTNYPGNPKFYFEAASSIIGGEAYTRLVRKSDTGLVAGANLVHNSSSPTWKISGPITLYAGNHTYIVQVRSSSGEKVVLEGARVKVIY